MKEINNNKTYQIAKELNKIGNQLTLNVNELINEVNSYTDNYCDQTFIAPSLTNDSDEKLIKNVLKKGETIFDKIQESSKRNEFVIQLENLVDSILNKFNNKMNEFREKIFEERESLIERNNEILDNLKILERITMKHTMRNSLKQNEDIEMKKKMKVKIFPIKLDKFNLFF